MDLIDDNRRRLIRVYPQISDECLYWQPDSEANSIAVTTWHMGRLFDIFLTRQARGEPPENEVWMRGGWAERTGYDPRGLGSDGWGSVNGYTPEQVAAIPRFTRQQLLDYFDEVLDAVKGYLSELSGEQLFSPAPGFEGRYSIYQVITMAMMDNTRHLGEIYTIKSMWERRQSQNFKA
jgi:uncharacterized damage-inducible protein DinB